MSGVSEPCEAVGTNANPTHLGIWWRLVLSPLLLMGSPRSASACSTDFDPDDDITMRDPSRKRPRKAPPAPRPKQRRKTKAAPVEPILSEYELGRRAKIKRNNKFLVSVGLLFPPKEALEDDEHPWWYMTAR